MVFFKKKAKPTFQYKTPIGPVRPGETIKSPTPGIQYNSPIGPTRYGGGGGSSSNVTQISQESIRKAEEAVRQKAAAEAAKQAEAQRQAQAEQQRILNLRRAIVQRGAQQQQRILRDAATGARIRETITTIKRIDSGRPTDVTVQERVNLSTGESVVRSYEKKGVGQRKVLSGSVTMGGLTTKDVSDINLQLPKGDSVVVNPQTGKIEYINSKVLGQKFPYTEKGIELYNTRLLMASPINSKPVSFNSERRKVDLSTPKAAYNTAKALSKLILVTAPKQIPKVLKDYGVSLAKGTVKTGLYIIDNAGQAKQIRWNPQTGKYQIPANAKLITDRFGKTKKWASYNYKTAPWKDPDYQNFAVTGALAILGAYSPATVEKVFGVVKGKAVYDAIRDPSPYNVAIAESLFIPGAVKKLKKAVARRDILVAKTGELVPLKERIKQVDFLVKSSNKKVTTITAKPSGKAKFTNVRSAKNPDFTYGKQIEFGTYKVGKALPTSEYFLKGKGTKLQKAFKTGRVNIEEVVSASANRRYGSYIKKSLLSKQGRVPESFIKKYYAEVQAQANRINKPVAAISPKRLRGFWQAEQELVKVLPTGYKPKKLGFAGFTEEGYRVFSDRSAGKRVGDFLKTKGKAGKIQRSYFKELTSEKLQYLKGRKAIRGEYAEHGLKHLKAAELDPRSKAYAKKLNVKKYGNVFDKHDLAKVADADSFAQFEHGDVLYKLWKKGQFPDKSIYKLPKKLQSQIAEAYAGHTPVKPRLIDTLRKGWKDNSVTKDLFWYLKNKRNPYLQDVLTLDRIDLPRAGRWNYKVNYKLLDKRALKRIYGSELNAVKNIRFLDWKTVPSRLKAKLGAKTFRTIRSRDASLLKTLKARYARMPKRKISPSIKKYTPTKTITRRLPYSQMIKTRAYTKTPTYKALKSPKYKSAYSRGYAAGYKASYGKPSNYKTTYGKYQNVYSKGYADAYKGGYKLNYKTGKYQAKAGYKPSSATYKKGYGGKAGYTPREPTKKPPVFIKQKSFKPKTLSKSVNTYYVVEKRRGKYRKLYPKPLTAKDARDYAVYSIDNNLSKTAFFIPLGKARKVVQAPKNIQGYYSANSRKVRPYRIRYGKKNLLVNGFIEKRKYFQDTRGERSQLKSSQRTRRMTAAQKKAFVMRMRKARGLSSKPQRETTIQNRRVVRRPVRRVKRSLTPAQRRVLLQRLKKARAARMRNLRRKR